MKIKLLDGSLSYPLENKGINLNTRLWTAQVLIDDPHILSEIHSNYVKCGVDYISTSSYQLSHDALLQLGYRKKEINKIFKRSVDLAVKAVEKKEIEIVGSFGPFGSLLADGSEYTGKYKYDDLIIKNYHKNNFEVINNQKLDIILYETIPSLKEIKIISDVIKYSQKKFWISMTCNKNLKLRDNSSLKEACKILSEMDNISVIGVNCIDPLITSDIIKKLKDYSSKKILVYPNSGEKYNSYTKKWDGESSINNELIKDWISLSPDIIGGCCRVGYDKISKMRTLIDNNEY
tara:strand:+ start:310 stop:1182 length:873 start_codon:yes stop_codon:yes gene_type:complete